MTLPERIQAALDRRAAIDGEPRTRHWLSKEAPIDDGYLSRIMDGTQGRRLGHVKAVKMATALGVSVNWLADGTGLMVPPELSTELDARYQGLMNVLEQLGDRISPEARAATKDMALKSPVDLDEGSWTSLALGLDRKLRRQRKTGGTISTPVQDEDDTPPFGRDS